jgi:outer membrane usher protein
MNVSMTRSGTQRDYHGDVSGSVLLYQEGVAFGQTLGSTAALVQVPGSAGIGFYNQFGSTTNAKGDLMVSYLTPWRVNRITVDSFSLPEGIAMDVNELETVPTDGAIVNLRFLKPEKTEVR